MRVVFGRLRRVLMRDVRTNELEVPRILAVDDVRLRSQEAVREAVRAFYTGLLGLEELQAPDPATLAFRGVARSGPRVVVEVLDDPIERPLRRQLVLEVASLHRCADVLAEHKMWHEWSRGWHFYDRTLNATDPAGNWVSMVGSHPFR